MTSWSKLTPVSRMAMIQTYSPSKKRSKHPASNLTRRTRSTVSYATSSALVTDFSTFSAMIHMAEIELDSHYKEGLNIWKFSEYYLLIWIPDPMWSAKMQSKIIQSILQNMFIPPVLFSLHEDLETKTIIRRCIDGRQRLASIQKFMDGQVCVSNSGMACLLLIHCRSL